MAVIPYNISQTPSQITISGTPTAATQRQSYSWTPTVSGGFGYRTYTLSGELPPRMTFNPFNGTIGGIPRWANSISGLSITVTDASGSATLSNISISVASAIANLMIGGSPGNITAGQAYTFTPTVTGGSGARSFTFSGRLANGLSFNSATGTISGTPTDNSSSSFVIAVTDAVDMASFSGVITPSPSTTTPTLHIFLGTGLDSNGYGNSQDAGSYTATPSADVLVWNKTSSSTGNLQQWNPQTLTGQLGNANSGKPGWEAGFIAKWKADKAAGRFGPTDMLIIVKVGWNGAFASEFSQVGTCDYSITSNVMTVTNANASGGIVPLVLVGSKGANQRKIISNGTGTGGNGTYNVSTGADVATQVGAPVYNMFISHSPYYKASVAPGNLDVCYVQERTIWNLAYAAGLSLATSNGLTPIVIGGYNSLSGNDRTWALSTSDYLSAQGVLLDTLKTDWNGCANIQHALMRTPFSNAGGPTIRANQTTLKANRADVKALINTDDLTRGADTEHFLMGALDNSVLGQIQIGYRLYDTFYNNLASA